MNINCSELRKDIDKTREAYDRLHEKTEEATESGKGKSVITPLVESTIQATDQTLEKYLDTFFDKFPQLLQIGLGERIEGFKDKNGYATYIFIISPLSNGNMLIGGENGALYETQIPPRSLDTLKQSLDKIISQS